MKFYVWYWVGASKERSHFESKTGKKSCYGPGKIVPPAFPNLPDHDTEAELAPEDLLALANDFDVQILERDGKYTLHLDMKFGNHRQKG